MTVIRPGKKYPGSEENYYLGEYGKIFSAYATNFQRRFVGSSGGVVTEIVANLLADKVVDQAIMTRFSRENPLQPEGYIVAGLGDLSAGQGSKYSPVPLNSLLGQLDLSKKYAYVGLPCHVQGLDMYLKKIPGDISGNFFKIGLFCSRTNTLQATKELLRLNKTGESEIESIRYRGSGHPGYFSIFLKNGKQKKIPHLDPTYWTILFKRYFVQYRCWLCPDKTAFHADISCGDDWSLGLLQDRVGSSSVICRSPAAVHHFERLVARGNLAAVPMRPETLIASQGLPRKTNIAGRKRVASLFKSTLPLYPGYQFKKEPLSLRSELAMLMRIRMQGRNAPRWLIACDLYLSPALLTFRRGMNFKGNFRYFLRLLAKIWQRAIKVKWGDRALAPFRHRPHPDTRQKTSAGLPPSAPGAPGRFHVVTCGGYGFQDIGDEAMPKALIANLEKAFPEGMTVSMLSPDPEYTRRYHGHPAISDIQFHSPLEDTEGLNREMERYLRWACEFVERRKRLSLKLLVLQRREFYHVLKLISRCDALLNVGGGNINSIIRKELYKKCTLHRIARILGKPVFISGQTIGPFDNDNDRAVARESLELAAVLTFRDRGISSGRVAELGVTGPLMYDAGDDALSLSSITRAEAQKLIAADAGQRWQALEAKATWGINLKGSLKIFKGKGRSGDLGNEITLMARICEHLVKTQQAKILLISTDFCPDVDDRLLHRRLHGQIDPSSRQRIAVLENSYDDHQLKGITGCCDFVLGCRYHFLVFALSQIVPAIGIASGIYQQTKLRGILELLGLSEYFVPQDMEYATTAEVFPLIERLWRNRESIQERLRQNIPLITAKSMEIVAHMRSRLSSNP